MLSPYGRPFVLYFWTIDNKISEGVSAIFTAETKDECLEITKQKLQMLADEFLSIEKGNLEDAKKKLACLTIEHANIEKKYKSFMRILGVEGNELMHSNFLAWLLDPLEEHGLGIEFPKSFLALAAAKIPNLNLEDVDYSSLIVERETSGENSRLNIRLVDTAGLFNCIVENKIFSDEGEKQAFRLYKNFSGICPKELFVFLTLDEDAVPKDKHFISVTYTELLPVLSRLSDVSTGDTKILIKNYLTTLKGLIMSSKFNGYSEKTQLYFKYSEQIHDVNASFNQDRKLLLLALKERIIGSKWWSSNWEMEPTDAQISIWKKNWFKDKSGVYFWLYPSTERPAFFLTVYGEQSPFYACMHLGILPTILCPASTALMIYIFIHLSQIPAFVWLNYRGGYWLTYPSEALFIISALLKRKVLNQFGKRNIRPQDCSFSHR
jgi:hypothetical protein